MKSHRPESAPIPATRRETEVATLSAFDADYLDMQTAVGNAELAARLFQPPAEGEDAGVEAAPGLRAERPSAGTTPVTPQSYVPPANATDEELYAFYANIARQNGNLHPLGPNGQPLPTVVGLRGVDLQGRIHPTENRRSPERGQEGGYDDTLIVLQPDGTIRRMAFSSHPFQNNSRLSPDVDRDGRGDVGTIRPGEYYARAGFSHAGDSAWSVRRQTETVGPDGLPRVAPGDDHIPAWRDTDHDFKLSPAERTGSEGRLRNNSTAQTDSQMGDYATSVLFHQIRPGVPTDSSIACQVMPQRTFQGFEEAVGPRSDFNYQLIDVNGVRQGR